MKGRKVGCMFGLIQIGSEEGGNILGVGPEG